MKLPRGYSTSITLKTADPGLMTLSPEDASGQELGSEPSRIFVAGGAYERECSQDFLGIASNQEARGLLGPCQVLDPGTTGGCASAILDTIRSSSIGRLYRDGCPKTRKSLPTSPDLSAPFATLSRWGLTSPRSTLAAQMSMTGVKWNPRDVRDVNRPRRMGQCPVVKGSPPGPARDKSLIVAWVCRESRP